MSAADTGADGGRVVNGANIDMGAHARRAAGARA